MGIRKEAGAETQREIQERLIKIAHPEYTWDYLKGLSLEELQRLTSSATSLQQSTETLREIERLGRTGKTPPHRRNSPSGRWPSR